MKNSKIIELSRTILEKSSNLRSISEIEKITKYLREVPFFKDRKIRDKDLDELVGAFHFESFSPGEQIMEFGEVGNKFYIQFKGVVSVSTPNSEIRNWRVKRLLYLQEKKWYEGKINQFYDLKKAK